MTIGTTISAITGEGNGVVTSFTYPFLIPAASDVVVIYTSASGAQTTLPVGQYSISGVGSTRGGTVTYPLAGSPIGAGASLTIQRVLPLVQTTTISNQGPTFAATESELDYQMMAIQQQQYVLERTIQLNSADINPLPQLPPAAIRANQMLGFDSNGNPITAQPSSALVSTVMQPVVDAVSVSYAASLLGVGDWVSAFSYMTPAQVSDVIAGTLTQDVTLALNTAFSTGDNVKLPAGDYLVSNQLNLNTAGQIIAGDGIGVTTISVTSSFNLASSGVFSISAYESLSSPGPTIAEMDIAFNQVSTSIKANLTQFPPAVYINDTLRWRVEKVRMMAGWNGVYAFANTTLGGASNSVGGGYINACQFGCLNSNIYIDGATDTVRITENHFWPFGLNTSQQSIYMQPSAPLGTGSLGVYLARCDDFHLTDNLFLTGTALFMTSSVNGDAYGEANGNNFNVGNGLNVQAGILSGGGNWFGMTGQNVTAISVEGSCFVSLAGTFIENSQTTGSNSIINVEAGTVQLTGLQIQSDTPLVNTSIIGINCFTGSNAYVTIGDSYIETGGIDIPSLLIPNAGGTVNVGLNNVFFSRTANTTFSNATVLMESSTAILRMANCGMSPKGTGSGDFIITLFDNYHRVIGNSPNGWLNTFATASLAVYQYN